MPVARKDAGRPPRATVNRIIRWPDGSRYELHEGRPVDAPQEVLEWLRRVGYVEDSPEGGDG